MKVFAYSCRDFDEKEFFLKYAEEFGIELGITPKPPNAENSILAEGYDYISILTNPINADLVELFHNMGIKMISTRTVGYDHIDCQKAKELGMHVSNVSYTPESVADYTVMLMLMAIRKIKRIMQRAAINDFTLKGIAGQLLSERTVGIIGTGSIGRAVIRDLQGFGCKIYAYDINPDSSLEVEYLKLDELFKRCDLISLHAPLTNDTHHMINRQAIEMMPDGVVLINTGRGALIDSDAMIDALESGKIGACALDVIEDEFNLYYYDRRYDVIGNRRMSILRDMPNVIVTPHMAFYTDRSVSDMVENSLRSCLCDFTGENNPWQVI